MTALIEYLIVLLEYIDNIYLYGRSDNFWVDLNPTRFTLGYVTGYYCADLMQYVH